MSNKQSSVEWLINEIEVELGIRIESTRMGCEIVEQAKAMHKEECIKYYVDTIDYDYGDMGQHIRKSFIQIAEKMYNETFGGNNEQQ